MDERWLPVAERPAYEVSSHGRMRRAGVILRPQIANGYPTIFLKCGRPWVRRYVHRMVLLAFVGEPPTPLHECAHADGDRSNPRVENLSWVTRSENAEDRRRHGTLSVGEKAGPFRFVAADIQEMRQLAREGFNQPEIAAQFGCHQTHVSKVLRREIWRHVP